MLVFLSTDLFSERMGQAVESRSATRFCSVQLFNCVYIYAIGQLDKLNARFCVELKRCPSFQKTLPMALENITDENLKRCP